MILSLLTETWFISSSLLEGNTTSTIDKVITLLKTGNKKQLVNSAHRDCLATNGDLRASSNTKETDLEGDI